jgi:hypothetical protein
MADKTLLSEKQINNYPRCYVFGLFHANSFFFCSPFLYDALRGEWRKNINVDVAFHCGQGQKRTRANFCSGSSAIKSTSHSFFVQIIYSENFVSEKYIHIKKKEHNCSLALVTLVRCLIAKNYMRTLICVKKSYFIWTIKSKYLRLEKWLEQPNWYKKIYFKTYYSIRLIIDLRVCWL